MPRGFWSTILIAVACGAAAALVTLPFVSTDVDRIASGDLPGLLRVPLTTPVPEIEPTPSPEPTPVARRVSRPAAPAQAPAPAPATPAPNTIDDLPEGPFGSAKDAVKQSQQQP